MYDPFIRGKFPVGVLTIQLVDRKRNREFPCELWYPASQKHLTQDISVEQQDQFTDLDGKLRTQAAVRDAEMRSGTYPLILFSHASGVGRRSSTFLCTHLSSHGYIVAALDHSELTPELSSKRDESKEQRTARIQGMIVSRVPDIQFLLDSLLLEGAFNSDAKIDGDRIGIVGHSFGGWTALSSIDVESRIHSIVALAPGGASQRRPGILPGTLEFKWQHDVPTLILAAENDVSLPLSGIYEIFERIPATKRIIVLRNADHIHFMDEIEERHESVRNMQWPEELAWLPKEMRPIEELCSGEQAQLFVRGLTVCHMDAILKQETEAQLLFGSNLAEELQKRGVESFVPFLAER